MHLNARLGCQWRKHPESTMHRDASLRWCCRGEAERHRLADNVAALQAQHDTAQQLLATAVADRRAVQRAWEVARDALTTPLTTLTTTCNALHRLGALFRGPLPTHWRQNIRGPIAELSPGAEPFVLDPPTMLPPSCGEGAAMPPRHIRGQGDNVSAQRRMRQKAVAVSSRLLNLNVFLRPCHGCVTCMYTFEHARVDYGYVCFVAVVSYLCNMYCVHGCMQWTMKNRVTISSQWCFEANDECCPQAHMGHSWRASTFEIDAF